MKKEDKKIIFTLARYLAILAFGLSLPVVYKILESVTTLSSAFLLNFLYSVTLSGNAIIIDKFAIILNSACVAGAAFFLLFLLNFSTPMTVRKRVYSLIFSFLVFFAINLLRIFVFSIMFINSSQYFDFTHRLFWDFLSGIIVFLVWLFAIRIFRIKNIPFYTDIKLVYKKTKA